MAEKLLEIKGVSKIFRIGGMIRGKKLVAVDDVSISIDSDKPVILSVVGESGCGKIHPVQDGAAPAPPGYRVISFWTGDLIWIKGV